MEDTQNEIHHSTIARFEGFEHVNQTDGQSQLNRQSETTHYQAEPSVLHHAPFSIGWFKKWGSLIVLSLALAIIIIDSTILNVSLTEIIHELNTTIQSIQWVITGYSLTLAALTITGGRIGDLFGRKRMFMVGAVIFAIGSFLASISTSIAVLLAGEAIIEGIGAALMMPATASLLVANFHGKDRAMAFGIWGGVAAASSAIGPILGGWLTNNYSWRWAFRINVGVALLLLIGSALIKESHDTAEKPTLDIVGVLLSALGMLSVVYAVIEAPTYGWLTIKQDFVIGNSSFTLFGYSVMPLILLFGLLMLDLFFEWELLMERRHKTPLVSMKIFTNRQFSSGSITTGILSLGMIGLMFVMPVYLRSTRNLDALHTGIAMLPMSMTLLFVAPLSGYLASKLPPKRLIQSGLFLTVIAGLVIRASLGVDTPVLHLVPGFVLFGIGMGLVMAQISNITLSAVSVQQAGEASGVNNTLRQVGSTLGATIIGTVLLATLTTNLQQGVERSSIIPVQVKHAVTQNLAAQSSNVEFEGGVHIAGKVSATIENEIVAIGHQSTVDAARLALLFAVGFSLLGFIVSFSLPDILPAGKRHGSSVAH